MKTNNEEIKQKIDDLRKQLHKWNYEYYVLNQPSVDDYTFDQKLKELEKLELEHPEFADPNSPTVRVGGQTSDKFIKHLHHGRKRKRNTNPGKTPRPTDNKNAGNIRQFSLCFGQQPAQHREQQFFLFNPFAPRSVEFAVFFQRQ